MASVALHYLLDTSEPVCFCPIEGPRTETYGPFASSEAAERAFPESTEPIYCHYGRPKYRMYSSYCGPTNEAAGTSEPQRASIGADSGQQGHAEQWYVMMSFTPRGGPRPCPRPGCSSTISQALCGCG